MASILVGRNGRFFMVTIITNFVNLFTHLPTLAAVFQMLFLLKNILIKYQIV
jgi:hypothetical protein